MQRVCAISVDVDGLDLYAALHGLPVSVAGPQAWTAGVRRFLDLFDRRNIAATFFVVGQDIAGPGPGRELAAEALRRGHELANHSLTHPPDQRRAEVEGGARAIESMGGGRPRGFRSPGYALDDDLLRLVAATGHSYDSSAFPSPSYAVAKRLKIAALGLTGRRSASARSGLRGAFARRNPYRPDCAPSLIEVPIATTPALRIPLIGSTLLHLGARWFARALPAVLRSSPVFNLELHAVDLVGVVEDRLHPSLALRPDPGRMSLSRKAATLETCLDLLAARCRFDTLAAALGVPT